MLWIWGSDEGKVYFLFGSPGMGRVCSGMWSLCVGRTSFKIWGSDVALGTVATGVEESDRPAPGFGGLEWRQVLLSDLGSWRRQGLV